MTDHSQRIDFGSLIDRPAGLTVPIPEAAGEIAGQALVHQLGEGLEPSVWGSTLGNMAARLEDEAQRLAVMSAGSAAIHEMRHFHDLCVTPWGKRVSAAVQAVTAAFGNVSRILAGERSFSVPLKDSSKPFPPDLVEPAGALAACIDRAYSLVGRSPSLPDSPLEARHLFEAAAMSVQSEFFTRAFGLGRAVGFAREISGRPDAEAYTRCWALFNSVADQVAPGVRFDPAAANAVLFWCLCADPADSTEFAHPVDRLNAALAYILHIKVLPDAERILPILEELSDILDLPVLQESLPEAFRESPLNYFDPGRYLECTSLCPAAPIWVTMPAALGGPVFAQVLQDGGWRAFGISEGRVLVLSSLTSAGVKETTPNESGRVSIGLWMALALSSRRRLEPLLGAAAMAGLRERFPNATIHGDI